MSAFAGSANWRLRKESNESPSLLLDAGNSSSYSGSGTTWSSLRNSFNYTLVNSPTFVSSGESSYFDLGSSNTNKYFSSPALQSIGLSNVTGFTYEVWVRARQGVILGESNGAGWDIFLMEILSTGYVRIGFWIGSGYGLQLTSAGILTNDTWYQITMTYNGTTLTGYVNGILSDSGTVTKQWPGGNLLLEIGSNRVGSSSGTYFRGGINRFSIYNRALSATEVLRSFNAYGGRFGI